MVLIPLANPASVAYGSLQVQRQPNYYISIDARAKVVAINSATGEIDYSGNSATTVIQSAIGAIPHGGTIVIRAGNYSLTKNPSWPSGCIVLSNVNNIKLQGEGNGTILRVADGQSADAILVQYQTGNVAILNMQINGNKANQAGGNGIEIDGAGYTLANVTLQNLYIHDTYGSGIWVQRSSSGIYIYNNLVTSNQGADYNSQGIKLYTAANVVVEGNTIRYAMYRGMGVVQGSHDILIENNVFDHPQVGMEVAGNGNGGNPSYNVKIISNYFHDMTGGNNADCIRIEDASYNAQIASNKIQNVPRIGIYVLTGGQVSLTANNFINVGTPVVYQ
jgi:hypothetical protein